MQFLFTPVSHPRLYNISNFILTPRDWDGPRGIVWAYQAVYRAIPWFRNIAWRTCSNFLRFRGERDRELSEKSRKFFRAMTTATATAFPRFLHLKTIDHFAWFFPQNDGYVIVVNSGIIQTTHTRLQFWFVVGQTTPRRFDTRSLTLRSVTSPGFWDIKASRQKVDMTSLKINEPIVGM